MIPQDNIILVDDVGSLATMKDGRVVTCYTKWEADWLKNVDQDRPEHWVYIRYSHDSGQTWSRPRVVAQRRPDELPNTQVCYPFPCQAPDGKIVLSYTRVGSSLERGWNHPMRELIRVDPDWLAEGV